MYSVERTSYDKNMTIIDQIRPSFLVGGVGRFVVLPGAEENMAEVVDSIRLYTYPFLHNFVETRLEALKL